MTMYPYTPHIGDLALYVPPKRIHPQLRAMAVEIGKGFGLSFMGIEYEGIVLITQEINGHWCKIMTPEGCELICHNRYLQTLE